jgi:threonylcarbamoyladenosine tRNA methylthiotransferase MtaB
MKYSILTFGCRVNQADSLAFEDELRANGAQASSIDAADVVIVNTCSVTASSDQGARQTVRRLARQNPRARIVVTGCYATRRPDEVAALPRVARVVSNDQKPLLVRWLRQDFDGDATTTTAERFGDGDGSCGLAIEPGAAGRTAFTLRLQTGCEQPCSYCIIPSTRGLPRSVPVPDALRQVRRVAEAGFKEIILTGVHLGSYGRDLTPSSSLLDMMSALERVPEAWETPPDRLRFRVSSIEPMDCSHEIVDLVAGSERFAPHFHLPLQHASDRMLALMRRPYTIDYYADLTSYIRSQLPLASIGSDVIVGFPGETREDFEGLVTYLSTSPLTHLHVFPYSDRPGTLASTMEQKVPGTEVRERARGIREIGEALTKRFHDSQIGTEHRALTLEDGSLAVTGNYLKVSIPPGRARNEWVRVRITGVGSGSMLTGELEHLPVSALSNDAVRRR